MLTKLNHLFLLIMVVLITILPILSGAPAQANSPALLPDLLQFTMGPHVVGFLPDKVYLVGMPHMLSVEFEGTAGVRPVVEDVGSKDFQNPSRLGQAPPSHQGDLSQPVEWH